MKERCSQTIFAIVLIGCVAFGSGCGITGNQYYHDGRRASASSISPPPSWRLSGRVPNVTLAVDNDRSTASVSSLVRSDTEITIDLQKACVFNTVHVHHGSMEDGYCARVAVLTSLDGVNFTLQQEVPGTKVVTTLMIIRPILARYVKVKALRQGPGAWSVAEIYLQ